ncbi:MAG: ThuA domain-containing protein [Ferruginibacter sp.]|nr:ThuA domain-containing protein [Cytophagales bacterium]
MLFLLPVLVSCVANQAPTAQNAAATAAAKGEVTAPRRIEILFLGDNGHHQPIERVPSLMAALGAKGINFTYTDQLGDLNPANLNKYDGLLIYANHDSIGPVQEKALLDYVASGKGLIPVHCASYCFRNSEAYVKLVGGQFKSHGMDTIQSVIVNPAHPAIAGVGNFRTYDETYVHDRLNPDNTVLSERPAGDRPEPYTWVRNHGQGRVFYTAYGHDEATFDNPGFHALMEKGILWAVGDRVRQLRDGLNPQPFAYAEASLPNYEKRSGPQLRQEPLSPEESMKHIQVPPDFTLELFAHEPDVMHPIAMTWDERGRLFVLITKDYPHERKERQGSDYILICEDTTGDGKADKFTRYAEGLSVPTGLLPYDGGLIVTQAPHILYLKDTDGDDRADVKKTLLTGFGTFDTHAGPSNLHYGFDNWIWGSVGYSGFKGKVGNDPDSLKFGQGFFRFRPDGSQLEYVTSTSNNTWGLAFDETGSLFGSTANNAHGWYAPIPHRYFSSAPAVDNGGRGIDTHKDMKPITSRVRQVDVFGGFTAASGHNFYTARAFPKAYWNRVAFVSEPTGHVVHQNVMTKQGTDYEDTEGFNLLAGADEWVAPVFAEVGPDGAVWVADWYSFIVQHNPTPKGFKNGPGNAYVTNLRDYTHGRLYRIAYKGAPAYAPMTLSKDRPQELVAALKNTNMFWRQTAQRLLVERGEREVIPQLIALVKDQSLDEIGLNPAAIHALWTLHGLGALDGSDERALQAARSALKHADAGVRKTAVQVLPHQATTVEDLLQANTLGDQEPLVVLNTLLALSQVPLSPAAESAVLARLEGATETNDRWLPDAFACVLTSHQGKLLKTYLARAARKAGSGSKLAGSATVGHHSHADGLSASAATAPITATAPAAVAQASDKPDLVITGVRTQPVAPAVRETARIFIDVQNRGGAAIPRNTVTPLAIRVEGPSKRIDMVSLVFADGLAPGESTTITQFSNGPWVNTLEMSSDKPGTFSIAAVVDRDNGIEEGDESNNAFTHRLTYRPPPSLATYVLERSVRSYASVAPVDSVVALLRQAQQLDSTGNQAVVKGISKGWSPKRKASVRKADQVFVNRLSKTVSVDNQEGWNGLLQAWGLRLAPAANPDATVIRLRVVREALQFDKKEFSVTAGKPVEITFENPDAMQHNVVIGKPASLEIIGAAADKMITAPNGAEQNYVPSIPQVLFATKLVDPDGSFRLQFTAPSQPGDYPFVCTFPGHWRVMNGVMKVKPGKAPSKP